MQAHRRVRSPFFFLTLLGSQTLISASPLQPRQAFNCTDPAAVFDASCWAQLGVVDFLSDPKTGWNATTKICSDSNSSGDGADCCATDEPWSTCFLRLAYGSAGYDCTSLNAQSCAYGGALNGNVNSSVLPQYRYVTRAIFAINDLFTTWYSTAEGAASQVGVVIPDVITAIDPEQKTNFTVSALEAAIIAGLPYFATPYMANILGVSLVVRQTSQALLNSLQTAPAVSKALFPSSSSSSTSQQISISALNETLDDPNGIAENLNTALNLLMMDLPTFIDFASSGAYTDATTLSLPSSVEGMDFALRTLITTSALSANGYVARVATQATTLSAQAQCMQNDHMDPANCANLPQMQTSTQTQTPNAWADNSTGLIYTLGTASSSSSSAAAQNLTATIFDNGWTSPQALFAAPYQCAENGWFDAGVVVNLNATQGLDLSCLGRLMECAGDGVGINGTEGIETCPGGWTALSG